MNDLGRYSCCLVVLIVYSSTVYSIVPLGQAMQRLGYRVYLNFMGITTMFWTLITPEVDLHMGILLPGAFAPSRYTWGTAGTYKH